ncbi:MAG TPA: hypothetical protein VFS20_19385 [Longimicrobium sp.]|nr:hypothetical protein [Longimicrobium sp.]
MMGSQAALTEVFRHVRARIPRLGVGEYLALLHALDAGFGAGPRELTFLCQALWAKSPAEQRQVAQVVEAVLAAAREAEPVDETPPPPPVDPPPGQPPLPPGFAPPGPVAGYPDVNDLEWMAPEDSASRAAVEVEAEAPAAPRVVLADLSVTSPFDLEGTLPVTRRQMSRAWRFYRRMGRRGVPVEVDAEATVRRLYRDGVLAEPVLVPRRTNQARALILEDVGGSMLPFRYVSAELIDAARHAGLARVEVRYFHDVPVDVVFRDPALLAPVALEDAAARYVDAGVLVYSDAGAARGGMDPERVRRTQALLDVLWRTTPNVAWLNPVPAERWRGTTAGEIRARTGVSMFALDRAGLEGAVDQMRGLGR